MKSLEEPSRLQLFKASCQRELKGWSVPYGVGELGRSVQVSNNNNVLCTSEFDTVG